MLHGDLAREASLTSADRSPALRSGYRWLWIAAVAVRARTVITVGTGRPLRSLVNAMPTVCPICGSTGFLDFSGRPGAVCADCGALERHRALVRTQAALLSSGRGRTALEVGPLNPRVFGDFLRRHGWIVVCVDQSRRGHANDPRAVDFIDFEADMRDLSRFATGSVDLLIAQHVIEEIPDYGHALAEAARVLSPTGCALLEIPFDPDRETSERHAPDRFGNVWRFGADVLETASEHLSEIDVLSLEEGAYAGRVIVGRHGT
jgi:SAM-dependent methyltransferase